MKQKPSSLLALSMTLNSLASGRALLFDDFDGINFTRHATKIIMGNGSFVLDIITALKTNLEWAQFSLVCHLFLVEALARCH